MPTVTVGGSGSASKAAQARQKKILIVGAALLGVVLVIQVPRTLGMLKGSDPAASAPAPAAPVAPVPATPGTPAPTTPESTPATPSADPAAGKLLSFEQFTTKDPFAQQVDPAGGSTSEEAPPADESSSPSAEGERSTSSSEEESATEEEAGSFAVSGSGSKSSGSGPSAVITLNGSDHTVIESDSFPENTPVFTLVSVSDKGAEIAIANGEFRDGDETISLKVGKPLTLMNTVDGKRYKLLLVSTST
jgi:hypothetical protein